MFTPTGETTISTLDPLYQGVLGQRSRISHMDKLLVHRMYHCSDRVLRDCSLRSDPCLNFGYVGASCACVCPDGTNGTFCEAVEKRYKGWSSLFYIIA